MFFILTQNMLRLIIILFEIELRRSRFRFVLFSLKINLHMSLLSHFLLLRLLLFVLSFGSILYPQLEGHIIECILYRKYYRHYSSILFSILTIIYCLTHKNQKELVKSKVKSPNYSSLLPVSRRFCRLSFKWKLRTVFS
jgi:hypothetical protein